MELNNKFVNCPTCNRTLDGATCVDNEDILPKIGDLSVCMYCGTILEYEDGLFLHAISDESLESLKITDPPTYNLLIRTHNLIRTMIINP